jgi:predicted HD phosphohydrolase
MTGMAERLLAALASSGARRYGGEVISELSHALQCAGLAREGSADEELQLAYEWAPFLRRCVWR